MEDVIAIRRRFHRTELTWEDQFFLRILSTFGIAAWCFVIWTHAFPPQVVAPPEEEEIQIARVILKPPPPPPEPEKVELPKPKPEPLPPRASEKEKPGPAPAPKPQVQTAKAPPAPAGAPKATAKRSVATMGLLSILSKSPPRAQAASQRIGASLDKVDFREARDLTEDVSSLTGTVGARDKVGVGEMVAGLPRGSGTQVVLQGSVVTPVSGPGGGASVGGTGSGGAGAGGSRTLAEIRDVVSSYVAGLKYLYDRELKSRPSLHGKVTVEFVVTAPGNVQSVRLVSSGLGHPSLENAIVGRIRGWRFPPKPGDETRVTFPFDFVPPTS